MNAMSISHRGNVAAVVFALFALLFVLNVPHAGAQLHRACYTEGSHAKGDLEGRQQGVLSRRGKWDYQGRQHAFDALSLWGPDRPKPEKTCIRYELKNLSGYKIEAVRWTDAQMNFVDIAKGGRSRWMVPSAPPYPAVPHMSLVKAFERSSDLILAYVHTKRAAAAGGMSTGFAEFDISAAMPEAVSALDLANLPIRRVTVAGRDAFPNRMGFLPSNFSNDKLAFEHISGVFYEGQSISVNQSIKFARLSPDTEFSAPYISALNSLTSPVDANAVSRFAATIKEVRGQWIKPIDGSWGKTVTAPIGSGMPALFVVQYPVTVRTQEEILCLSVTAYSVVPVEAAANYCGAQQ